MKGKCVKILAFWLLFGLAAGGIAAVAVTYYEYQSTARLTGAVAESGTLPRALKNMDEGSSRVGSRFLEEYGYGPWDRLPHNSFIFVGTFTLLSGLWGAVVCLWQREERRKLEQRLEELTEYLRAVNEGKAGTLSRREDLFSHLEDEIYKTVMELACTKEQAVKDHQVLSQRIADIAHQLKTPLTSMALMTELLEEHKTGETEEYLTRLGSQVQRLQSLVSGLLALAKLDSHTLAFSPRRLEVSGLIRGAAKPLQEAVEKKKIALHLREASGDSPVYAELDPRWTEEALLNVLKNCVEHTPEGGSIQVEYTGNQLYTEVVIEDGGRGIAPEDLPHLFERFYRGRGAAKDSAGIGLALAKMIIENQKGHIRGENSPQGHARFIIRFYTDTELTGCRL